MLKFAQQMVPLYEPPLHREWIVPSHGRGWVLKNGQPPLFVHLRQEYAGTVMNCRALLHCQLLQGGIGGQSITSMRSGVRTGAGPGGRNVARLCCSMEQPKLPQSSQMLPGVAPIQKWRHPASHGRESDPPAGYDRMQMG